MAMSGCLATFLAGAADWKLMAVAVAITVAVGLKMTAMAVAVVLEIVAVKLGHCSFL